MIIGFRDHDGKGRRWADALQSAGHELGPAGAIAVVDHDWSAGEMCDRHDAVVLYPHGANPILSWDGVPIHHHVRLALVHGVGHAEVMALYGFPVPCVPVGWSYSDLAPPRYPTEVRNVLFAPSHPLGDGRYGPGCRTLSDAVHSDLVASGLNVTVRDWHERKGLSHDDIDAADLVVADGTVAFLAAARGCPMVMFGSDLTPDLDLQHRQEPRRWSSYRDRMRYPFDYADAPVDQLIGAVCQPNEQVDEWRRRFVGGPFDPDLVVRLVEAVAENAREEVLIDG